MARKCVDNAECCNLPAEYVCKCKPGFEGDGQVECRGEWLGPLEPRVMRRQEGVGLLSPNGASGKTWVGEQA